MEWPRCGWPSRPGSRASSARWWSSDPADRYPDARAFQLEIEQELLRQQKAIGTAELAEMMARLFEARLERERQEGSLVFSPRDSGLGDDPNAPISAAEPLGGVDSPTTLVRLKAQVPIDEQPTVTHERPEE